MANAGRWLPAHEDRASRVKKIFIGMVVMLFLVLPCSAGAQEAGLKPYQKGDWSTILSAAQGRPLAIHFWGVTCPTYIKEMPQWGAFLKANPNARIVFMQVDDVSLEDMRKMLKKADLVNAKNYYISGAFDERLRYEIDPKWHGETPTTFLVGQNSKIARKTGTINFLQLKSFLMSGK
jgi:thiol-disulfide isomerase/thioredoxin